MCHFPGLLLHFWLCLRTTEEVKVTTLGLRPRVRLHLAQSQVKCPSLNKGVSTGAPCLRTCSLTLNHQCLPGEDTNSRPGGVRTDKRLWGEVYSCFPWAYLALPQTFKIFQTSLLWGLNFILQQHALSACSVQFPARLSVLEMNNSWSLLSRGLQSTVVRKVDTNRNFQSHVKTSEEVKCQGDLPDFEPP